jgi:hypothetical protein
MPAHKLKDTSDQRKSTGGEATSTLLPAKPKHSPPPLKKTRSLAPKPTQIFPGHVAYNFGPKVTAKQSVLDTEADNEWNVSFLES